MISALLGDFLPWLLGAGAAALAWLLGSWRGKRAGKKEARTEDELTGRRTRDEVEQAGRGGGIDARRERLRDDER